jgi:hypothetical protein
VLSPCSSCALTVLSLCPRSYEPSGEAATSPSKLERDDDLRWRPKLKDEREQGVRDAAFCLHYLLNWRHWLLEYAPKLSKPSHLHSRYGLTDNFLSRQTFVDIVNMCQSRILLVKMYRERYSRLKIAPERVSSRFSEYVFQYCRMAETNSPLFGVLGFKRHLSHFRLQIEMAATSGLVQPDSKRGVPNSVERVNHEIAHAPDDWHMSDVELGRALDIAARWWSDRLLTKDTGLTVDQCVAMASDPVGTFTRNDLCNRGVTNARSDEMQTEISASKGLAGDDDDLEPGDTQSKVAVLDPGDEDQASRLLGGLLAQDVGDSDVHTFYKEVCYALRNLNSDLVKMAQDRRFRFIVEKMFHSQGKSGGHKYDYWSEDDNVLAVCAIDGGEDVYVAANVVQVVVLSRPPTRAGKPSASDWHDALPNIHRVAIDYPYPERLFLVLRVYHGCDGKGTRLSESSTRRPSYYRLPLVMDDKPEKWPSESLLGHLCFHRVKEIGGESVSRMYKEGPSVLMAAMLMADVVGRCGLDCRNSYSVLTNLRPWLVCS